MKQSTAAVLHLLRMHPRCAEDFAADHVYRASARVMELREAGYVITRERCDRHAHRHRVEMYRLVGVPEPDGQVRLEVGTGR